MSSIALNTDWVENSSDFLINEEPTSLSDKLLKLYARSIKNHYLNIKDAQFPPSEISPNEASKYLKHVKRSRRWFEDLESKYDEIKDINSVLFEIYQDFVNINIELEFAEERLTKLKDPKIHARILKSVNQLKNSSFLKD